MNTQNHQPGGNETPKRPALSKAPGSDVLASMKLKALVAFTAAMAAVSCQGCESDVAYDGYVAKSAEGGEAVPEVRNMTVMAGKGSVTVLGETDKLVDLKIELTDALGNESFAAKLVGPGKFGADFKIPADVVTVNVPGFGIIDVTDVDEEIPEMPTKE